MAAALDLRRREVEAMERHAVAAERHAVAAERTATVQEAMSQGSRDLMLSFLTWLETSGAPWRIGLGEDVTGSSFAAPVTPGQAPEVSPGQAEEVSS